MRDHPYSTNRLEPADVDFVAGELRSMFDLRACWFEPFPFDVQLPRIEAGRVVLPGAEPGVAPWCLDAGVELPVRLGDLTIGRFVLLGWEPTSGIRFPLSLRVAAADLAERVAPAVVAGLLADRE
jgi:hypothetical protein